MKQNNSDIKKTYTVQNDNTTSYVFGSGNKSAMTVSSTRKDNEPKEAASSNISNSPGKTVIEIRRRPWPVTPQVSVSTTGYNLFECIVSGGETGVERIAMDIATAMECPSFGWCTEGRVADDGVVSHIYTLRELKTTDSKERTRQNILDSDGTLIVFRGRLSLECILALRIAQSNRKPFFLLDITSESKASFRSWIINNNIKALNVTGSKQRTDPVLTTLFPDICRRFFEGLFISKSKSIYTPLSLAEFLQLVESGSKAPNWLVHNSNIVTCRIHDAPRQVFPLAQKLASRNTPHGYFLLGLCYINALGVAKNVIEGIKWLERVARQGNIVAQQQLAGVYSDPCSVAHDRTKAVYWYIKAAEQGEYVSQCELGTIYYLEGSYDKAVYWFEKSARCGFPKALCQLGCCYANGLGVDRDFSKAVSLLEQSAKQQFPRACYTLGAIYTNREYEGHDETKAMNCFKEAAQLGSMEGMYELGMGYHQGRGVPIDDTKAFELFEKAAHLGYAPAMNLYGFCFNYGVGTKINYDLAMEWFRKAYNAGSSSAATNIGRLYMGDWEGLPNFPKALKWYFRAARKGDPNVMVILGDIFLSQQGNKKAERMAFRFFVKGAKLGDSQCVLGLGICYHYGTGIKKDLRKALKWYGRAGSMGVVRAFCNMGVIYDEQNKPRKAFRMFLKAAKAGIGEAMYNLGVLYQDLPGTHGNLAKAKKWFKRAIAKGIEDAKIPYLRICRPWEL